MGQLSPFAVTARSPVGHASDVLAAVALCSLDTCTAGSPPVRVAVAEDEATECARTL